MRICVITSPFGDLPPNAVGAVEKLFHQLAGEWVKGGHTVTFVCSGGGDNPAVGYVRLGKYRRTGRTLTDLPFDLWYSIKAIFAAPKCDILLCNTFWSPVVAPLLRWKYRRLVYGVHRFPKGQFWLYPFVHAFICVSTAVADALRRRIGKRRNVVVVNNPVDTAVFNPAARGRRADGVFTIVYAGRVHPEKGLDILFSAAELLAAADKGKRIVLKIIGPTAKEKGCGGEEYVDLLNGLAPSVEKRWVGEIRDVQSLAREMGAGDCFVYPSVAEMGESFGVAPLEAMALGLPVVVSKLECFLDFLKDGENGYVFNHRIPEVGKECLTPFANFPAAELSKELKKIISNPDSAKSIGESAAKTALKFSTAEIARAYDRVFGDLL